MRIYFTSVAAPVLDHGERMELTLI